MSKFGKIVVVVGVLALLAAAGATFVFAQEPDQPDAPAVTLPDAPANGRPFFQQGQDGRFGNHGPRGQQPHLVDQEVMQAAIADALGISVEELQAAHDDGIRLPELADSLGVDMADVEAAMTAVQTDAIAQAVEDGTLTQEQADAILSNIEMRGVMRSIFGPEQAEAAIAGALGISVEDLQAARDEGTRIPELADELGVDLADVHTAVQSAREDAINQAVADGLITQEQADLALSHQGPGGPGGHGGRGGCDTPNDGQGRPFNGQGGRGGRGQGGFPGQGGPSGSNFPGGFSAPGQNG